MQANDQPRGQPPAETVRLRVALVTETYPPEINGVAMTLGRLVDGLCDRGHRVQLVRPRQGGEDVPRETGALEHVLRPGLPIPRYPGLRLGLPGRRRLIGMWNRQRPDVVHVATEGPLGWSALAAARQLGIPVLAGFHTNFHSYSGHYGLGWLRGSIQAYLRGFHNRAGLTLAPTRRMQETLSRLGFRNVEVLARGVDSQLFTPRRRSEALRETWGVRDDAPAVIHVGRIAPEKNLDLLIRAFEAIRRIRPESRLVLVGDGPARADLRREHPDYVFCGPRHGEDLASHYASADLFLFPSLSETFGNVVLEAMASGLPVLAYDYAAAAEHIQHGVNGIKALPGDEAAFIGRAEWLACHPEALRGMGQRAREGVRDLSWENIHQRLEGYYRLVIAGPAENAMGQSTACP